MRLGGTSVESWKWGGRLAGAACLFGSWFGGTGGLALAQDLGELQANVAPAETVVAPAEASPQQTLERNVVKLIVTKRAPDLGRPWTKSAPASSSGSGVFLADGRILTNAHVAMHASQVFVQLRQGGDRLAAKVTALAPGIDLALVELEDPSQVDVPGLPLADALPETKTHVSAYGYPAGGDNLSVTDGIVSRIEFAGYYYGFAAARIQVDAALNPGNSGGPAIQDGRIVGLVFSKIEAADNIGYLIPAEEIRRFLDDVADGRYDGSWLLYDEVQAGENAALRAFLKLPPEVTGVVVTRPYGDAPDYPLQRWDVITKIGPHAIDNQGYVDVRPGLRMRYQYYVPLLASDGQIALTVLRGGETLEVQAPVLREAERLVPMLKEKYPAYFIYGPLTFTVATQEHVGAVGARGLAALAAFDSPLIKRFSEKPAVPGEELVVIATRNFPHPLTKGYEDRVMGVIESVNGEAVRNLRHLAELLRDSQEEYLIFDIAGRGESFVFPRTDMRDSTEEILVDEGIRYQASESLRDIWED